MSRGTWLPAVAALFALALSVDPARADGLDGERFAPAIGTEASFAFEHPSVPFHLGWGLGLFFNAADDAVVERQDDEVLSRPLDTAASIDLVGSVGLFGWAELGVGLPIRVVYDGDDYVQGGAVLAADAGVGDLRLMPKALLVRAGDAAGHFLLGLSAPVSVPTGDDEAVRGAGGVTVEPRLTGAYYGERIGLAAAIGYRWRAEHPIGLPYGDEIAVSAAASFELAPDTLSLTAELFGGKQVDADVEGADFPLEALAGLIYQISPAFDLHGGVGIGVTDGIGAPDLRGVVGIRYRHRTPERHGFLDADQDGILDKDDDCPTDVEDLDAFQDDDGCPELDNDEDGVPDETDECPDIPEEPGGDKDGCPSRTYVKIVDGQIQVFGKVLFRVGKADIEPRSEPLLDQLAAALKASPEVRRVRVEGHTDDVGDADFNQQLSERRATKVVDALESRGIDDDRLEPVGHGETRPAAPNGTPAGRAKNRRVEFIIVDAEGR